MTLTSAPKSGEMTRDRIPALVQQQRSFFATGATHAIDFRLAQLKALRQAIMSHEPEVMAALQADLGKANYEAYMSELSVTLEIDHAIKNLRRWAKPKPAATSIITFPSRAEIRPEPLGVALIIAPWNYPFQLLITPLIGAIAAGNCAILKPSELSSHTSQIIAKIIQKTFQTEYIAVIEGDAEISQALLAEKFDHIFFTGGAAIGKVVMTAAANHLTPVTLELGGKSPCIVDRDTDIPLTARRIVWGKFMNAGQTCVAPDYLLVHRQVKSELLAAIKNNIHKFYSDNPIDSPDYGRIISDRHFSRLQNLLTESSNNLVTGGETRATDRYIAPTILLASWQDAVMAEEIFGPILPVLEYEDVSEAIAQIKARPKPLALYVFSKNRPFQQRVLRETSSGGVAINDTILQLTLPSLPFGGVGESGMGSYHGQYSFDTFSHRKSVLYKPFWLDIPLRYAPYAGRLRMILAKWIMGKWK